MLPHGYIAWSVVAVLLIIAYMIYVLHKEHKNKVAADERYIYFLQHTARVEPYEPVNWQELYDRYYWQQLHKIVEEARNVDFSS